MASFDSGKTLKIHFSYGPWAIWFTRRLHKSWAKQTGGNRLRVGSSWGSSVCSCPFGGVTTLQDVLLLQHKVSLSQRPKTRLNTEGKKKGLLQGGETVLPTRAPATPIGCSQRTPAILRVSIGADCSAALSLLALRVNCLEFTL